MPPERVDGTLTLTSQGKDGRAALLEQAIRLKRASARSRALDLPLRPQQEAPRLGEMQRGLWLAHRLAPSSAAYNLVSAFRLTGEISLTGLERSLNEVVARHRILRSTYRADRDGVRQLVHDVAPIGIERLAVEPGEVIAAAVREARRPFDLEIGPLVRLLLIEERERSERLLMLMLHHILADERSLSVLWRELAEGYRDPGSAAVGAAQTGAPSARTAPQYDDYVHWMAGRDPEKRAAVIAYWKQRLDPLPDDLVLPFERRPAEKSEAGSAVSLRGRLSSRRLDVETSRRLRHLATASGTTPFIVHAFAFRLLLQRYTEGADVAFATPASTRSHPATAEMIGYFLNPVVISASIDEGLSVARAVRDFGAGLRDRLAHASLPFDLLLEELTPRRRRDRHPVFQAMFVYQESPSPPRLGDTRLQPVTLDLGESKFDLTLFVSESPREEIGGESDGSLEIAVEYRADRFDEIWMLGLLRHYATLIENLGEDLERPCAELSILGLEEIDRLRADGQGPPLSSTGTGQSPLLPQRILEQARRTPRAQAVIGSDGDWSYAELERVGLRIAAELGRRGVGPGARVGLLLDRSPLMIAGVLGSHWAGAAYVPLDPSYPSARNRSVLEDADVAAVLTRSGVSKGVAAPSSLTIAVDDLLSGGVGSGHDLPELHGEHPAYLLYTSGSTGRPKGVVVTHDNLRASTGARLQVYDAAPERFLLLPSVAFDSSVAGIFWTLAAGGALIVPTEDESRDPRRLAQLVDEKRGTCLLCVPSLYAHLLAAGPERLKSLDTVIVAGESCPPQLADQHFRVLPQARLFNEYGPTEATVWASVHELERGAAEAEVPIGRPIPGVRIDVLDGVGRLVPAGVPGEGWISGPTVADGYWHRPDLTQERFVDRVPSVGSAVGSTRRAYRTGDRLARTADGRLLFLSRVDEQIKLRGFRIEPGEIESALLESADVSEAAVVAREPGQLVAFVTATGAIGELRDALARRLPEFMVPSRIVELPDLPRLPNGKVDRGRLQEVPLGSKADIEPRILNDREQVLVSLWESLLRRPGIGVMDNFFQLGGHSLLVVEMTAAIEQDLGVALAPAEVFQNPTIRDLAARIGREGGSAAPAYAHLFPIEPGGTKAPFVFCVPHFFSEMFATRFRGERPVYGLRGVSLRPEGNRGRWRTMRNLGEELVEEIGRRFQGEACIIAGYSFGASMAVETVRLMEERGISVERLILIGPMPVDFFRLGPFRIQIDGLRRPVEELSLGQAIWNLARHNHPLRRRPYSRAWRFFAIQPWRRLLCLVGKLRGLVGLPLTPRILHADVRLERFRLHAGYRPGIVRTPTVIFNAREPETDAAATWRPYFEGPFTVHETSDPHLGEKSIQAAKKVILDHLADLGDS